LFTSERRSLDILSVKKEAKLSASELAEVKIGMVKPRVVYGLCIMGQWVKWVTDHWVNGSVG